MITNGIKEDQLNMWKELSDHASCRKLLGGGAARVDTQWQSTKTESTRLLISFMKQAIYSSAMDSTMKQSIKSSTDPKDVIQTMQLQLKEALDEILTAFKKEAGPQAPEKLQEKDVDMGAGVASLSVEIGELVTLSAKNSRILTRTMSFHAGWSIWKKCMTNGSSSS